MILTLLLFGVCIALFHLLSYAENNEDEDVVITTRAEAGGPYPSIKAALAEASEGDTIEVIKGNPKGHKDERFQIGLDHGIQYNINLQKSNSLSDEVCFDCDYENTDAYFYNGATFKDLSFNFGNHTYHGIDGAGGTLTFNNCKLYGLQHGYVTSYFNDCIFDNTEHPVGEYNM